jgi:hypothetical protein
LSFLKTLRGEESERARHHCGEKGAAAILRAAWAGKGGLPAVRRVEAMQLACQLRNQPTPAGATELAILLGTTVRSPSSAQKKTSFSRRAPKTGTPTGAPWLGGAWNDPTHTPTVFQYPPNNHDHFLDLFSCFPTIARCLFLPFMGSKPRGSVSSSNPCLAAEGAGLLRAVLGWMISRLSPFACGLARTCWRVAVQRSSVLTTHLHERDLRCSPSH